MRPSMIWRTAVHLHLHRNALTVDAAPLSRQPLPYAWLRDACPCTRCVHPSTRQKLFQTGDLKQSAAFRANVREDALHVQWDDGHKSTYPISFLERYMGPRRRAIFHHETKPVYWDAQSARQSPALFLDYVLLNTPDGRLKAYNQLFQYGLLFIRGVPTEITSDAGCELRTLAGHFGELRRTFYGETWDVQSVKGSRNIVYTNLNLGLHMDLLYFHHPPRYQILHCLRNRVRGGTSLFVDAFHAAESLSGSDCMTLADIQVPFHYVNDGHHLHHTHPKFEVDRVTYQFPYAFHDETILKHVNYSPPFQAPLDPETPPEFYQAMRAFTRTLENPERMLRHRLREGEAVLFDNRRVLHARTAFGDSAEGVEDDEGPEFGAPQDLRPGEPDRWLKGCYLEADALLDRRRVMLDAIRHDT